jgi:two-component system, NarL family, response regulator DevR
MLRSAVVSEATTAKATIRVLLLEPDQWRFRGMAAVLENGGDVEVVGDHDYARLLTAETRPDDLTTPCLTAIAQRLIMEYGIGLIPHMKDLFDSCPVLVHGEHESLESTASILAAGGAGFYSLEAPPHYLLRAVTLAANGKLWGSREAVALMASRIAAGAQERSEETADPFAADDLALLRFLHEGLSNKEIASRLNIAEVTVKSRLGKLYKRFGVSTRLQLLSAALKQGIISPNGG